MIHLLERAASIIFILAFVVAGICSMPFVSKNYTEIDYDSE